MAFPRPRKLFPLMPRATVKECACVIAVRCVDDARLPLSVRILLEFETEIGRTRDTRATQRFRTSLDLYIWLSGGYGAQGLLGVMCADGCAIRRAIISPTFNFFGGERGRERIFRPCDFSGKRLGSGGMENGLWGLYAMTRCRILAREVWKRLLGSLRFILGHPLFGTTILKGVFGINFSQLRVNLIEITVHIFDIQSSLSANSISNTKREFLEYNYARNIFPIDG